MQKSKSEVPTNQLCIEEQVSEEIVTDENRTEMMDTAPVKQQPIIMDDQNQLVQEVSLDDSRDEARLKTIEKIKKIEQMLQQNNVDSQNLPL